jgi:hypothetical protein
MQPLKLINPANGDELITFDSEHARGGLYFVSWNASSARVLVPDSLLATIDDMRTAKRFVVVSRGPMQGRDVYELLFDDGSDSPFALHIETRMSDRLIPDEHKPFTVDAWTRAGKAASWPGRYRVVETLPCLAPWIEH